MNHHHHHHHRRRRRYYNFPLLFLGHMVLNVAYFRGDSAFKLLCLQKPQFRIQLVT